MIIMYFYNLVSVENLAFSYFHVDWLLLRKQQMGNFENMPIDAWHFSL